MNAATTPAVSTAAQPDAHQPAERSSEPGDKAVCLLDVPVHKTGTAFTKPVDPILGHAVAAWEAVRPSQPAVLDRKTSEHVHLLFSYRAQNIGHQYLNNRAIPALCAKAGVPTSDVRGKITSHRARSTIATQLYNAKEPMTLLELLFDANGQLRASVNLLPILGNDRKEGAPPDDEGIELAEVVTAPFKFLSFKTQIGGGGLKIHATKGSPFEILNKSVKDAGKAPAALEEFVVKSNKAMPFVPPPDVGGPPRTGRTPEKAIPFIWWKPFNRYRTSLTLPASQFGKRHAARPFPHKKYVDERRGTNLELGVNNWPYVGMVLRKRGNDRGAEVDEFIRQCEEHGVTLPPGYQIDHVIDLVFEGGTDSFDNLWPLNSNVNTRAGARWTNGQAPVQWRNREIDPPVRSAPNVVPVGRYFVIADIQDPT